jgi:hypothetical protein
MSQDIEITNLRILCRDRAGKLIMQPLKQTGNIPCNWSLVLLYVTTITLNCEPCSHKKFKCGGTRNVYIYGTPYGFVQPIGAFLKLTS